MTQQPSGAQPPRLPKLGRIALGLFVRLVLPAVAFAILFTRIDAREVGRAFERVSIGAAASSLAWVLLGVLLGLFRWRYLLTVAGARGLPGWERLLRWYLIGMFFNLLPGGVGGDVYRAYVTRPYFPDSPTTRAAGVALIERALGLLGLVALAALAALWSPFRMEHLRLYAWLSLLGIALALGALVAARRLVPIVPTFARRFLEACTVVDQPGPIVIALLLSIATHVTASMNGYAVIEDLAPEVSFFGAMTLLPVGTLASYFPFTIAGAGARDAALVVLLAKLDVSRPDALVTSLAMFACNVVVSMAGGVLYLARTGSDKPAPDRPAG